MAKKNFDNNELILGVKNKDKDAFVCLFDTYYLSLHNFARSIVLSSSLADDIVQDVFLKLWDSAFELNISSSLKAYLFTMVKNRSLNSLRKLHISYQDSDIENDVLQIPDYKECCAELSSFYELVNMILQFLPEQSKIIVRRRILDGLKFKEIASELGISEASCKMIMQRSVEKIKMKHPNLRGLWILVMYLG